MGRFDADGLKGIGCLGSLQRIAIEPHVKVVSRLQKVGTAGTEGTGKQSDLRGRNVYFLHLPIHF